MRLPGIPFSKRSLGWHGAFALLVLGAVLLIGSLLIRGAQQELALNQAALKQQQVDLTTLRDAPMSGREDFASRMPGPARADDVVRDLGKHAELLNVQLNALSLQHTPGTAAEHGKVSFMLTANGGYTAVKSLLAEVLGRFPTLSVQSSSMRGDSTGSGRVDAQVVLVLFVKS